jgi:hypothetical protein
MLISGPLFLSPLKVHRRNHWGEITGVTVLTIIGDEATKRRLSQGGRILVALESRRVRTGVGASCATLEGALSETRKMAAILSADVVG